MNLKALDDVGLLTFGQLFFKTEQATAVFPSMGRVITCTLKRSDISALSELD